MSVTLDTIDPASPSGLIQKVGDNFVALADDINFQDGIAAAITASPTQTQAGATPLAVAYNVITTCATSGDAVRLPASAEGKDLYIVNVTANPATVWPDSGGDLGEGTDSSMTILAGQMLRFKGIDASSWTRNIGTVSDDSTLEITSDGILRIKDNGVTLAKLSHGTANRLFGTDESGVPSEIDPNDVGTNFQAVDAYPGSPVANTVYLNRANDTARFYEDALSYFSFTATYSDNTAPTVQSATVSADGTTLTVVFSESVTVGADAWSGFDTDSEGTTGNVATYSSGSGTDTVVFTLASTIFGYETVDLDYTQPGDGVQDASANLLATFSDVSVVNNSTQFGYIVNETFSPAGLPDGTDGGNWTETSNTAITYFDGYARIDSIATITADWTAADTTYLRMEYQTNTHTEDFGFVRIRNASGGNLVTLSMGPSTGDFILEVDGVEVPTSFTHPENTRLYLFVEWVRNTSYRVSLSTIDQVPSSDNASTMNVTGVASDNAIGQARVQGRSSSRNVDWHDLQVAEEDFFNRP